MLGAAFELARCTQNGLRTLCVEGFHAVDRVLIGRPVGALGHQRDDPVGEMMAGLRRQAEASVVDDVAQQHRSDRRGSADSEQQCRGQCGGEPAPLHQRDDQDERHRRRQQGCDGGPGGRSDPAGEAGDNGESVRRVTKEARAGEQHQGEEEEGHRLGQDLGAEHDERDRERGQNAGDQSDQRRDQGAERGDERAGSGVDDGLQDRHHPGSVAENVPDAAQQQRIERHAIGLRQQRRPEALGSRQPGAEFPVSERIGLRKKGFVSGEEREIDQANEQREQEHGAERMSGDATGHCGEMHRRSRDRISDW